MQVDLYQLGRASAGQVLARIGERIVADGGRLLIVAGDEAAATAIDAALWAGEDSFLPHGRATADDPGADQPVLIAADCVAANGARHVAFADGVWRDGCDGFDRVFHLFDESNVEAARGVWRALGARDGVTRNFWRQDEAGRWVRAA